MVRRELRTLAVVAAVLLAAAAPAVAQPAAKSEPPAAAGAASAPGGAQPAAAAGAPEAGKGGDAKAGEPKKPSLTGGYSWSDKPAKKAVRRPKKKLDPNAAVATYPGFRMLPDGSSQVWVQVNRKVAVQVGAGAGHPTFVLTGADAGVRNNTRPLVTHYFETPLARARLRPDPAGAQLVLELREGVQPKHRVVDGPSGTMILYVDLPKPTKSYAEAERSPFGVVPASSGRTVDGKSGSSLPPRGPNP